VNATAEEPVCESQPPFRNLTKEGKRGDEYPNLPDAASRGATFSCVGSSPQLVFLWLTRRNDDGWTELGGQEVSSKTRRARFEFC